MTLKNALKDVQSKANRLISDNKKKHKSELKTFLMNSNQLISMAKILRIYWM